VQLLKIGLCRFHQLAKTLRFLNHFFKYALLPMRLQQVLAVRIQKEIPRMSGSFLGQTSCSPEISGGRPCATRFIPAARGFFLKCIRRGTG